MSTFLLLLLWIIKHIIILDAGCAWIEPWCSYAYCPKVPDNSCYLIYDYDPNTDNQDSEKYQCSGSTPNFKGYHNANCDSSGYLAYRGKVYAPISSDCNGSGNDCPYVQYKSGYNGYKTHIIIIDLCLNHTITSIDDNNRLIMKAYASEHCEENTEYSSRIIANATNIVSIATVNDETTKSMDDAASSGSGEALVVGAIIGCLVVLIIISFLVWRRYKKVNVTHDTPAECSSVVTLNEIAVEDTMKDTVTDGGKFEYKNVAASAPPSKDDIVESNINKTTTIGGQYEYNDVKASAPQHVGDINVDDIDDDDELPEYEFVENDTANGEEGMEGVNDKYKIIKEWFETSVDGIHDDDKVIYFDKFIENGFDNFIAIKEMNMEDLKEIGIELLGHRKTIFHAIRQLQ